MNSLFCDYCDLSKLYVSVLSSIIVLQTVKLVELKRQTEAHIWANDLANFLIRVS